MSTLRVATYNIHKGVQGLGPVRRLEIHNLAQSFSRWPVQDVAHEDMSDHRFEQRCLLHVNVAVHGGPVHVLAGDFNDWGGRLQRPVATSNLWTFEGVRLATFPSRLPLIAEFLP